MVRIERFEDIEAWQCARRLTQLVYRLSNKQQFSRDFGLKDQIRRAAVSAMSNIAEGFERSGDREFHQFLATAKGSAGEVRSQGYVALDAGYVDNEEFNELYANSNEVSAMIAGFMRYLNGSDYRGSKYRPPT